MIQMLILRVTYNKQIIKYLNNKNIQYINYNQKNKELYFIINNSLYEIELDLDKYL